MGVIVGVFKWGVISMVIFIGKEEGIVGFYRGFFLVFLCYVFYISICIVVYENLCIVFSYGEYLENLFVVKKVFIGGIFGIIG